MVYEMRDRNLNEQEARIGLKLNVRNDVLVLLFLNSTAY